MFLLLLACGSATDPGKPADGGGDSADTGDTAETGDTPETGDTGAADLGCPPWSGLTPGVTRMFETLPGAEEAIRFTGTWTETTVREGELYVYERLVEATEREGTSRMRSTATFRCDAAGAWILAETMQQSYQPVVGDPTAADTSWVWTSDFLYFPRELEVGLQIDTEQTVLRRGTDRTVGVAYTFRVTGEADRDTVLGPLATWEVELWDASAQVFADPQGRVASYPYELSAYVEE